MDRYVIELRGLADELLDMVSPEDRDYALDLLRPQYPEKFPLPLPQKRSATARRFLSTPPSGRETVWASLDQPGQIKLWCDCRFLALLAADAAAGALEIANQCSGAYRKALAEIALGAAQPKWRPTAEQIAHMRLL